MKRHYFISNDLDALIRLEVELESRGIAKSQLNVLSNDELAAGTHEPLHNIEFVFKQDMVHSTLIIMLLAVLAAVLILSIGYITSLPETYSWIPFHFLAIIMFAFVTWSGGFYDMQTPYKDLRRIQKDLVDGKHIFIVDTDLSQEEIIRQMEYEHPHLIDAGTGSASPRRVIMGQKSFKDITSTSFP